MSELLKDEDLLWAKSVVDKIDRKMPGTALRNKGRIPYTTGPDGRYDDRMKMAPSKDNWHGGPTWWTNGFFAGMLWQLYHQTGDPLYRDIAAETEPLLDPCFMQFYDLHHDVGFMWMMSAGADYRITGNAESRRRALHSAALLAGRFNPAGSFIRAWNNDPEVDKRGWSIIDTMMNLSLLYWASEETGDPRYSQIAKLHSDRVIDTFVRDDGSVCHIVKYDPETGRRIRSLAGQGYAVGSSWTRGQAWALYGFAIGWYHTRERRYLYTAKRIAEYFTANIPENGLIPIDFRQPKEPAYEDSCGACAAASGLIFLSRCLRNENDSQSVDAFLKAALKILKTIDASRADWTDGCDAIVQNCSAAYHSDTHNMTMVYADYFFVEAMLQLTGQAVFLW